MGQLRDRMQEDLKLRGLSRHTQRIYVLYCRKFAAYWGRSPEKLGEQEIRQFLLHVIQVEQVSHSTYRQIVAALKFLYTVTLARAWEVDKIPFPQKRTRKLPKIPHANGLVVLFQALGSPKYRAILICCYAAGLRISEACRLRVADIDSQRMVIRVEQGKGKKDRYTILSPRLLEMLRCYWRNYKPKDYLFPGQDSTKPVCPETVRTVFRQARKEAGFDSSCKPHTLRHAFATHLLEQGTDLIVIKALLGHASIQTTSIYTHVSTDRIGKVKSPLDRLPPFSLEDES